MITAILAFLPALIGLVGSILARRWARDTPQARHDDARERINLAIADGDVDGVNSLLDSSLDRLQDSGSGVERKRSGEQG
jgi:hypothetical protein